MKKSLSVFIIFIIGIFCSMPAGAEEYFGVNIPEGSTSFADAVVSYNPGPNIGAEFSNPQKAIGEPDFLGDEGYHPNAVSLGDSGVLVIEFTNNSLTTSGDDAIDLWFFELATTEASDVAISEDGTNWIEVGRVEGSISGVDIDSYLDSGVELWEHYNYVKITDAGLNLTSSSSTPGADIDAVAAISSDPPAEYFPKADAGNDQIVPVSASVTLNGANSTPPINGSIDSYAWTQTDGPTVTLSGDTSETATFTAPSTAPESLTFQLTVTDSNSRTNSDTITVNIAGEEEMPVASISPSSQTVEEGVTVILTGSNSDDPDGTIASYQWEQVSGTTVTLSSTTAETITFASPNVGASGDSLEFELTVTDNDGLKNTTSAVVNVSDINVAPTANAGADATVAKGATVTLDGSLSSDADANDTMTYNWTQLLGDTVTLSDPNSSAPTFTAPSPTGDIALEFLLTVTDNGGLQGTDSVIINVTDSNTAPTAEAGENQAVTTGATVTLDGSASTDTEDGAITNFFWNQLSGTPVELSDPAIAQPTFTAPGTAGALEFELTVTDSDGLKGSDSCAIVVAPAAGDSSSSCFIDSMRW